ncbi:hypothetical protein CPC08DRAFT_729751 [Agrocybe pediades]|nr:hypothetical protein CPC08DRAFT_729751 [Agrocybe pediades]
MTYAITETPLTKSSQNDTRQEQNYKCITKLPDSLCRSEVIYFRPLGRESVRMIDLLNAKPEESHDLYMPFELLDYKKESFTLVIQWSGYKTMSFPVHIRRGEINAVELFRKVALAFREFVVINRCVDDGTVLRCNASLTHFKRGFLYKDLIIRSIFRQSIGGGLNGDDVWMAEALYEVGDDEIVSTTTKGKSTSWLSSFF